MVLPARNRIHNTHWLACGIVACACIATGGAVKAYAPAQDRGHHGTATVSTPASGDPAGIAAGGRGVPGSLLQEHAGVQRAPGGGMSLAVLWGCIVAVCFALASSFLYLCSLAGGQRSSAVKSSPARGSMRSAMSSRRSGSEASLGQDDTFTEDESCMSSSTLQTRSRSVTSSGLPGLPLCHLLVVPDGTRLACFVQTEVKRKKQDLAFEVSAVPSRGGAPLFRMRVSEMGPEPSKIFVETLGGREQLAELSTEELWRGTPNPSLAISRPWGLPYGHVQKGDNGEYLVLRSQSTVLILSGDYKTHNIQIQDTSGHTIATTMQTSPDEYQVHMQARTDAGLVILALLAIDKCELAESPASSSRALALRSEDALPNATSQVSAGRR